MNNYSVTLLLFYSFATSVSALAQENYSFLKLMVTNEKEEILLVKWSSEWEIPGTKFTTPTSLKETLESLASTTGVAIKSPKIFGLYTQRWKGASYHTLMHYYQATYISGDIKVPEGSTDVGWFSIQDALELIPYKNMRDMINWYQSNPGKIAGAAFERYKNESGETVYEKLEDWYQLN